MIQVDIGGHPPIPLGPPPLFLFSLELSLVRLFEGFSDGFFQSNFFKIRQEFIENRNLIGNLDNRSVIGAF